MSKYNCIIIGGGPGGYKAALKLKELNKSVCIIEKIEGGIGGTCLHKGCIPVKSLLESADLFSKINKSSDYGINATAEPVDMAGISGVMKNNISLLNTSITSLLKTKSIEIIYGNASFLSSNSISVACNDGTNKELEADNFIIASGSLPKEITGLETDGKNILNSSHLIDSDLSCKNIIIVGGGYIGCEFASFYNKLGIDVTLIEICSQILPGEDIDVSRTLAKEFKKQGIQILTDKKITGIENISNGINVSIQSASGSDTEILNFDRILIATGRSPNTLNLNLEKTGVLTDNGFVKVNSSMRTNIANIYAVGDVINTPMLAHTAYREGIIAAQAISGVDTLSIDYNSVPRIVFSSPQVGCMGSTISSKEESETGTKKIFFKANPMAVIKKKDYGFIKISYNKKDLKISGVSIVGPEACEIIHILCIAMEKHLTINELSSVIYGHPTLSEIIGDALTGIID